MPMFNLTWLNILVFSMKNSYIVPGLFFRRHWRSFDLMTSQHSGQTAISLWSLSLNLSILKSVPLYFRMVTRTLLLLDYAILVIESIFFNLVMQYIAIYWLWGLLVAKVSHRVKVLQRLPRVLATSRSFCISFQYPR